MAEGAHLAEYAVPRDAIVEDSPEQVLFILRRGRLVRRTGHEPPSQVIRSSAGSRTEILQSDAGTYAYVPGRSLATLVAETAEMAEMSRVADAAAAGVR